MSDHIRYARLLDAAIVIGLALIVFHLILGVHTVILVIGSVVMIAMTGLGLYFKFRGERRDIA